MRKNIRLRNSYIPRQRKYAKNILCKISNEGNSILRFIPYGKKSLSKQGTMRNIILQHNLFLQNMAIIPIINISTDEKEQVKIYSNPRYTSQDSNLLEKYRKQCIY